MARVTEEYLLKLAAKVEGAEQPLDKILTALELIQNKAKLVNIAFNLDNPKQFNALIRQLARELEVPNDSMKTFTNVVTEASKAFGNLTTRGLGAQKLGEIFVPAIDRAKVLQQTLSDVASAKGLNFAQIPGFFSLSNAIKEATQASNDYRQAIKQFGPDSAAATSALHTLIGAMSQVIAETNRIKATGENFKPLTAEIANIKRLLTGNLNRSSLFSSIQEILPTLAPYARALNKELEDIGARGFSQQGDVEKFQAIRQELDLLNQALTSIKGTASNLPNLAPERLAKQGITSTPDEISQQIKDANQSLDDLNNSANNTNQIFKELVNGPQQLKDKTKETQTEVDKLNQAYFTSLNALKQQKQQLEANLQAEAELKRLLDSGRGGTAELQKLNETRAAIQGNKDEITNLNNVLQQNRNTLEGTAQRYAEFAERIKQAVISGRDLRQLGQEFQQIFGVAFNFDKPIESLQRIQQEISKVENTVGASAGKLGSMANAVAANDIKFRALNDQIKDFNFFMNIAIEKIIRYRVSFIALQRSIQAIGSTFTLARELDKQIADLRKVTDSATTDFNKLKSAALDLSRTFGVTFKEVNDIFFIFAQQGKSQTEIIELSTLAILGMKAANLEAKESVELITAAMNIYGLTAEGVSTIFDKLLDVQRQFAVTTQDLAASVKLLGTTAEQFGISIDSLFGSITAVVQTTRKTGNQVANSLKTIFARFVQDDVVEALRGIGIAVFDVEGNVRNLDDVLGDLADKWNLLTNTQRINIARLVGGLRRYNDFLVLMDQFAVRTEATIASQKAFGFTTKASAIELETIDSSIKKLTGSLQSMSVQIGSSIFGFGNLVSGLATVTKGILDFRESLGPLNTLLSSLEGGFLSLITVMTAVKGASLIAGLGFNRLASIVGQDVVSSLVVLRGQAKALNGDIIDLAGMAPGAAYSALQLNPGTLHNLQTANGILRGQGKILVETEKGFVELARSTEGLTLSNKKWTGQVQLVNNGLKTQNALMAKTQLLASNLSIAIRGLVKSFGFWLVILSAVAVAVISFTRKLQLQRNALKQTDESLAESVKNLTAVRESLEDLANTRVQNFRIFERLNEEIKTLGDTTPGGAAALGELKTRFDALKSGIAGLVGISADDLTSPEVRELVSGRLFDSAVGSLRQFISIRKNETQLLEQQIEKMKEQKFTFDELSVLAQDFSDIMDDINTDITNGNRDLVARNRVLASQGSIIDRIRFEADPSGLRTPLANQDDINRLKEINPLFKERVELLNKERLTYDEIKKISNEISQQTNSYLSQVGNVADSLIGIFRSLDDEQKKGIFGKDFKLNITREQIERELAQVLLKVDTKKLTPQNLFDIAGEIGAEGLLAINKVLPELNTKGGELTVNLNNAAATLETLRQSTSRSFQLSAREAKKLSENVSKSIAEVNSQFATLDEAVQRTIDTLSAEGQNFGFFEVQARELKRLSDGYFRLRQEIQEQIFIQENESEVARQLYAQRKADIEKKLQAPFARLIDLQKQIQDERLFQNSTEDEAALKKSRDLLLSLIAEQDTLKNLVSSTFAIAGIQVDDAVLVDFLNDADALNKLGEKDLDIKEAIGILNDKRNDSETTSLENLKKMLSLTNVLISANESQVQTAELQARVEQLRLNNLLKLSTKSFDDQKQNIDLISNLVRGLEFSNEAISAIHEKQNVKLQSQRDIFEQITSALQQAKITEQEMIPILDQWKRGTIDLDDIVGILQEKHQATPKILELVIERLRQGVDLTKQQTNATLERLDAEAETSKIINFLNKSQDGYLDRQKTISGLLKDANELLGIRGGEERANLFEAQKNVEIENARYNILKESLLVLKSRNKLSEEELNSILEAQGRMAERQKALNDLFGAEFAVKIASARKTLEEAEDAAKGLAGAFSEAFANFGDNVIDRFNTLKDQQESIRLKELEIQDLRNAQTGLSEQSDAYKEISERILDAQFELRNLNIELENAKKETNALKNTFTGFGKSISDVILKINTDQLEQSLASVLQTTSVGNVIIDAFVHGSVVGSRQIVTAISVTLQNEGTLFANKFLEAGRKFIRELEASLDRQSGDNVESFEKIQDMMRESIEDSFKTTLKDTFSNIEGRNQTIPNTNIPEPFRRDRSDRSGLMPVPGESGATEITDPQGKKDNQKTQNILRAIESAVTLLGVNLGTVLGANRGNPLGAQIGSTLGSAVGGIGADLTESVLGSFGNILFPGIGGILGGLIGGGIRGTKPKDLERQKIIAEDNTDALRKNTDAIRVLTTEFIDLRSELINAPSRFIVPPLGGGLGTVTAPQTNQVNPNQNFTPSVNAPVGLNVQITIQGNADQGALGNAVQQIEKMYQREARLNSNNSRLF